MKTSLFHCADLGTGMLISRKSPLGIKVTLFFTLLVALCIIMLSVVASNSLKEVSDKQLSYMEKEIKSSVLFSMQQGGENAGDRVANLLKQSFVTPLDLAKILSDTALPNTPFTREQMRQMAQSALVSSSAISSLYVQIEPDAYDGKDSENINNLNHSSNTGSVEIYWIRENGAPVFYPTEDAGAKYVTTLNEHGMREAEWYLCPKDSVKPCALDPYLYEIEPGKSELLTTLSAPIVANGKFLGIVGADINLPVVQTWLEQASQSLFNGKSELTLVSQHNLLIASTKYKSLLGDSINKAEQSLQQFVASDKHTLLDDNEWHVKIDVPIDDAKIVWTLIVSIPKNVALAPVLQLEKSSEETYVSAITSLIIYSLLFLVTAIAISIWLARSISSPIATVSNSIQNLSSNEGDLTQKVQVDNHQELILLAAGLNLFMEKLAAMIGSCKAVSLQLVDIMGELDLGASKVRHDTDEQQVNLDNMATAINEMAVTATEVSRLAQDTADNASSANSILNETQSSLQHTVGEVEQLSSNMITTGEQIAKVADRTKDITSIVTTIQGIAEQTNLLALNAAIEAARAGEMGRGFAVVADEVRSLAGRTQVSTQEISNLIQNLQTDVDIAVNDLNGIKNSVDSTVDTTKQSFSQLESGVSSINAISDSSVQVATAAEQQSQVSEEISVQVVAISDSSKQLAEMGDQLSAMSANAQALINDMNEQLNRLKS